MKRVVMVLLAASSLATAASDDYFSQWLNGPVKLIMAGDELKDFQKLQTPQAKLEFMRIFWSRRDPNPDTVVNEFRQEFEQRVAYANEHFAAGKVPGWQTPMGSIFIVYGPPVRKEPRILGGKRTEMWWYGKLRLPQLEPNEAFVFRDVYSDGRMYLMPPVPDPMSIVDVSQAQAEARMPSQFSLPFKYEQASHVMNDRKVVHPDINYDDLLLTGKVETAYEVKLIAFSWSADFAAGAAGRTRARIAVHIPIKEMTFGAGEGGKMAASMVLRINIRDPKGTQEASADEPIRVEKTPEDLKKISEDSIDRTVDIEVAPGSHQIELVLEDSLTTRVGYVSQAFEVPAPK